MSNNEVARRTLHANAIIGQFSTGRLSFDQATQQLEELLVDEPNALHSWKGCLGSQRALLPQTGPSPSDRPPISGPYSATTTLTNPAGSLLDRNGSSLHRALPIDESFPPLGPRLGPPSPHLGPFLPPARPGPVSPRSYPSATQHPPLSRKRQASPDLLPFPNKQPRELDGIGAFMPMAPQSERSPIPPIRAAMADIAMRLQRDIPGWAARMQATSRDHRMPLAAYWLIHQNRYVQAACYGDFAQDEPLDLERYIRKGPKLKLRPLKDLSQYIQFIHSVRDAQYAIVATFYDSSLASQVHSMWMDFLDHMYRAWDTCQVQDQYNTAKALKRFLAYEKLCRHEYHTSQNVLLSDQAFLTARCNHIITAPHYHDRLPDTFERENVNATRGGGDPRDGRDNIDRSGIRTTNFAGKQFCNKFNHDGSCRYGSACKYQHRCWTCFKDGHSGSGCPDSAARPGNVPK